MSRFKFKCAHVIGVKVPVSENIVFDFWAPLWTKIYSVSFIRFEKYDQFCKDGRNIYNLTSELKEFDQH